MSATQEQAVKAGIDTFVVMAGIVTFVSDVLPTLAVVAALALSIIRIINEWPQLKKTVRGWFRRE